MLKIAGLLVLAVLMSGGTATAQTMAERLACKADFEKLCPGVKPGGGRPFACLSRQQEKLSPACLKVIKAHGK